MLGAHDRLRKYRWCWTRRWAEAATSRRSEGAPVLGVSSIVHRPDIWESREQHDRWFEEDVKPNVPGEIAVEVIDVHNIVTP